MLINATRRDAAIDEYVIPHDTLDVYRTRITPTTSEQREMHYI